jgi:hypothetical protein
VTSPLQPATAAVRPTLRCLIEDLCRPLPPINDDLSALDVPILRKVQDIPQEVALGVAERFKHLTDRPWYKKRADNWRGTVTAEPVLDAVDAWWLGAAGPRRADSADDFYKRVERKSGYTGKGSRSIVDSSWMLPQHDDAKRYQGEMALRWRDATTATVRRLVARAIVTQEAAQAIAEEHVLSTEVKVVGGDPGLSDGEAYLLITSDGFIDPSVLAVILAAIPGLAPDDWQPEPGGAMGVMPSFGTIVYSTIIPAETVKQLVASHYDDGEA